MAVQNTQITAAAGLASTGATAGGATRPSDASRSESAEMSLEDALKADLGADADGEEENDDGATSRSDDDDSGDGDDDDADGEGDDSGDGDEGDADGEGDDSEGGEDDADESDGSDDDAEDDESKGKKKEDDDNEPPKGLENLPKWAQKRIRKQSEDIRTLRDTINKGGPVLEWNPQHPLAHVRDQDALSKEIGTAKLVRQLLGKLTDENYEDDNGVLKAEVTHGNQKFVFTKDEVAKKLAYAEAVLDPDVRDARREYLQKREQTKPWEAAEKALPGVFDKDTPEHKAYESLLKACPELAAALPNFEFVIACAVRGMRQVEDETAGKAKWQRFALDDKGKIILPKRKAGDNKSKKTGTANSTSATPSSQRPPTRPSGAKAKDADLDELQRRAEKGDEAAMRELLMAEAA